MEWSLSIYNAGASVRDGSHHDPSTPPSLSHLPSQCLDMIISSLIGALEEVKSQLFQPMGLSEVRQIVMTRSTSRSILPK